MAPNSNEAVILRIFCQSLRRNGWLPSRPSNRQTFVLRIDNRENGDVEDDDSFSSDSSSSDLFRHNAVSGVVPKIHGARSA